ncbi:nuclear fragile X mental retardation-interacting protein 2 isoform X2 [Takifugu rubripes]|uniref:Nuclear FMR1 interacting protein 2 n=1 Tax=Takifugu rubripes TaxID=31033 RepID=H2TY80_TAKRU|nr:nuclear fragile X mental retardation-interacting protein 2 isoform X2 [Takifugu rubripes]
MMLDSVHRVGSELAPAEPVPPGTWTSVQWLETWQHLRSYDLSLRPHPVISSPENMSTSPTFSTSMEEQPKDRAQDRHYPHHGGDRSSTRHTACVKHDQSHFQCHHQETQTKKTGNEYINSEEEGGKSPRVSDAVDMSHPPNSNGNRHVKQKSSQKLYTAVPKVSSKGLEHKKNMDLKHDKEKTLELNNHEGQTLDKKDLFLLQNGVINCGLITNGYSSKDNDGSGSEGGYTTPKKRKARCNNPRNGEHLTREKEKDMQQHNTTQEHEAFKLDTIEKGLNSRLEGFRAAHKDAQPAGRRTAVSETLVAESQRKNTDGKTVGTFGKRTDERHKSKLSSPSKEDSWTLFKPPPVFPVDNSSAKIVPKISYASKVKENLKVAQGGGGGETPPPPVRLSQVPMSAVKTITSASFTNGPVPGNGNGCPVGTFFAPAASSIPPPPPPSGENVASPLEINCSSASSPVDGDAHELKKCTLLIYPLNMQPVLPSGCHLSSAAAQTNQKALGDIFQNQWGLSFINEPNLGPEGGGELPAEDKSALAAPQSDRPAAARPCFDAGPSFLEPGTLVQDLDKRTCPASNACSPARDPTEEEHKRLQLKTKAEGKGSGSAGSSGGRESRVKPAQPPLSTLLFGSSKDCGRTCSWSCFDIKAAVAYHTKGKKWNSFSTCKNKRSIRRLSASFCAADVTMAHKVAFSSHSMWFTCVWVLTDGCVTFDPFIGGSVCCAARCRAVSLDSNRSPVDVKLYTDFIAPELEVTTEERRTRSENALR